MAIVFGIEVVIAPGVSYAQMNPQSVLNLPIPGSRMSPSVGFEPAMVKGLTIHPEDPLMFDFIVAPGEARMEGEALRSESEKLIKYFMAALTTPEDEMWVNLSPYERERIVPESFGVTEMGRDLLAQDYLLKQMSASLMYPEDEVGKRFWQRVREKAYEQFGTREIPLNTFNKIWIVPQRAVVYENGSNVFVSDSHLKVMLEEDYVALRHNLNVGAGPCAGPQCESGNREGLPLHDHSNISSQILRELIIPEIEREVNEGKTFANLRQIYNAVILAAWYKKNLKESLLGQVYVDKNKTKGIEIEDKQIKEKIYQQYLEAFKVGVYDFIKEEYDPLTQDVIPRKYFSGGAELKSSKILISTALPDKGLLADLAIASVVRVGLSRIDDDQAMVQRKTVPSTHPHIIRGLKSILNSFKWYAAEIKQRKGFISPEIQRLFMQEIKFRNTVLRGISQKTALDDFIAQATKNQKTAIALSWQLFDKIWQDLLKRNQNLRTKNAIKTFSIQTQVKFVLNNKIARQQWEKSLLQPIAETEPERYLEIDQVLNQLLKAMGENNPLTLDLGVSTAVTTERLQQHIGGRVIGIDLLEAPFAPVSPYMLAQGLTAQPIVTSSDQVEIWRGEEHDFTKVFYGNLPGRISLIRHAAILVSLTQKQHHQVISDVFRYVNGHPAGLLYHHTIGTKTNPRLFSHFIYHITGPHPKDWELKHVGYLIQNMGKDRSLRLTNGQRTQHEMEISKKVLEIRQRLIGLAKELTAKKDEPFDESGRVQEKLRQQLINQIFGKAAHSKETEILQHMTNDILLISPWTREYEGSYYENNNVLAPHELAWRFVSGKKWNVERLLDKLLIYLEDGDAAMLGSKTFLQQTPIKILIADAPASSQMVKEIESIIASFGPNVQLIQEIGIEDEEKLRQLIEQEKPTIVMIRQKIQAFKNPEFVRFARQQGVQVIIRGGVGVDHINIEETKSQGISVIRSHGNANSVANFTLRMLLAGLAEEQEGYDSQDFTHDKTYSEIFDVPLEEFISAYNEVSDERGHISNDQYQKIFRHFSVEEMKKILNEKLNGKIIGIVGFGAIAQSVAEKLHRLKEIVPNLEFQMMATSPSLDRGDQKRVAIADRLGVTHPGESALLEQSDIIIMLPDGSQRGYFDISKLNRAKAKMIINTSRHHVMTRDALEAFLVNEEHVYFVDTELTLKGSPVNDILTKKNVFPTPQMAGATISARKEVEQRTLMALQVALDNILGKDPSLPFKPDIVNGIPIPNLIKDSDNALLSIDTLLTQQFNEAYKDNLLLLERIGVKKGDHIVQVGGYSSDLPLAVVSRGGVYTGFTLEDTGTQTQLSRYDLTQNGGNAKEIPGEFSSTSSDSKIIRDHTQDFVLILTGALGPFPGSNSKSVFHEALRVVKDGGKIVVGTVGDDKFEAPETETNIQAVLDSSDWKGRVSLNKILFGGTYLFQSLMGIYEVHFSEGMHDNGMLGGKNTDTATDKFLSDAQPNQDKDSAMIKLEEGEEFSIFFPPHYFSETLNKLTITDDQSPFERRLNVADVLMRQNVSYADPEELMLAVVLLKELKMFLQEIPEIRIALPETADETVNLLSEVAGYLGDAKKETTAAAAKKPSLSLEWDERYDIPRPKMISTKKNQRLEDFKSYYVYTHAGARVPETVQALAEVYQLPGNTIRKIVQQYGIYTPEHWKIISKNDTKFFTQVQKWHKNGVKTLNHNLWDLSNHYYISRYRIARILFEFGITTHEAQEDTIGLENPTKFIKAIQPLSKTKAAILTERLARHFNLDIKTVLFYVKRYRIETLDQLKHKLDTYGDRLKKLKETIDLREFNLISKNLQEMPSFLDAFKEYSDIGQENVIGELKLIISGLEVQMAALKEKVVARSKAKEMTAARNRQDAELERRMQLIITSVETVLDEQNLAGEAQVGDEPEVASITVASTGIALRQTHQIGQYLNAFMMNGIVKLDEQTVYQNPARARWALNFLVLHALGYPLLNNEPEENSRYTLTPAPFDPKPFADWISDEIALEVANKVRADKIAATLGSFPSVLPARGNLSAVQLTAFGFIASIAIVLEENNIPSNILKGQINTQQDMYWMANLTRFDAQARLWLENYKDELMRPQMAKMRDITNLAQSLIRTHFQGRLNDYEALVAAYKKVYYDTIMTINPRDAALLTAPLLQKTLESANDLKDKPDAAMIFSGEQLRKKPEALERGMGITLYFKDRETHQKRRAYGIFLGMSPFNEYEVHVQYMYDHTRTGEPVQDRTFRPQQMEFDNGQYSHPLEQIEIESIPYRLAYDKNKLNAKDVLELGWMNGSHTLEIQALDDKTGYYPGALSVSITSLAGNAIRGKLSQDTLGARLVHYEKFLLPKGQTLFLYGTSTGDTFVEIGKKKYILAQNDHDLFFMEISDPESFSSAIPSFDYMIRNEENALIIKAVFSPPDLKLIARKDIADEAMTGLAQPARVLLTQSPFFEILQEKNLPRQVRGYSFRQLDSRLKLARQLEGTDDIYGYESALVILKELKIMLREMRRFMKAWEDSGNPKAIPKSLEERARVLMARYGINDIRGVKTPQKYREYIAMVNHQISSVKDKILAYYELEPVYWDNRLLIVTSPVGGTFKERLRTFEDDFARVHIGSRIYTRAEILASPVYYDIPVKDVRRILRKYGVYDPSRWDELAQLEPRLFEKVNQLVRERQKITEKNLWEWQEELGIHRLRIGRFLLESGISLQETYIPGIEKKNPSNFIKWLRGLFKKKIEKIAIYKADLTETFGLGQRVVSYYLDQSLIRTLDDDFSIGPMNTGKISVILKNISDKLQDEEDAFEQSGWLEYFDAQLKAIDALLAGFSTEDKLVKPDTLEKIKQEVIVLQERVAGLFLKREAYLEQKSQSAKADLPKPDSVQPKQDSDDILTQVADLYQATINEYRRRLDEDALNLKVHTHPGLAGIASVRPGLALLEQINLQLTLKAALHLEDEIIIDEDAILRDPARIKRATSFLTAHEAAHVLGRRKSGRRYNINSASFDPGSFEPWISADASNYMADEVVVDRIAWELGTNVYTPPAEDAEAHLTELQKVALGLHALIDIFLEIVQDNLNQGEIDGTNEIIMANLARFDAQLQFWSAYDEIGEPILKQFREQSQQIQHLIHQIHQRFNVAFDNYEKLVLGYMGLYSQSNVRFYLSSIIDAAMISDPATKIQQKLEPINKLLEINQFDRPSLSQMRKDVEAAAGMIGIENIEQKRIERRGEVDGYDKGYVLLREFLKAGDKDPVEYGEEGRLIRDGTLQPRIEKNLIRSGDWKEVRGPELTKALQKKLKEEFEDIKAELTRVLDGETGRINRLTVVMTNFLEAVVALERDQAMATADQATLSDIKWRVRRLFFPGIPPDRTIQQYLIDTYFHPPLPEYHGVLKEHREILMANPLFTHLSHLYYLERPETFINNAYRFLIPEHEFVEQVFSVVDTWPDKKIMQEADQYIQSWANISLRQLILHPTAGYTDVPQYLSLNLSINNFNRVKYLAQKKSLDYVWNRVLQPYVAYKAIKIMFEDEQLVLIQERDVGKDGELYQYLANPENFSLNIPKNFITELNQRDDALQRMLTRLLNFGAFFVDQETGRVLTSPKLESLKNLITLINNLAEENPLWKEALEDKNITQTWDKLKKIYEQAAQDNAILSASEKDSAMAREVGGIDMNPNHFQLEEHGQADKFNVSVDPAQFQNMNIEGFIPVIINITPVTNVPLLLGIVDQKEKPAQISFNLFSPKSPMDRKQRLNVSSS